MILNFRERKIVGDKWYIDIYTCPCGKGTIEDHHYNFGYKSSEGWIVCPYCESQYSNRRIGPDEWLEFGFSKNNIQVESEYNDLIIPEPLVIYQTIDGKINIDQFKGLENLKNPDIACMLYGNNLATILEHETEHLINEGDHYYLNIPKEGRPYDRVMRILGSVAEAIIVRRCNESPTINKKWLEIATRKRTIQLRSADNYIAIGTGLGSTKKLFDSQYFNRTDPQHDILWTNYSGKTALIQGSSSLAGNYAGIQVKTTGDSVEKILHDLSTNRYVDPLAMFSLKDGFLELQRAIHFRNISVKIGCDLINARDVDEEAYEEVLADYHILMELVTGKLTVEKFLMETEKNHAIKGSLLGSYLLKKDVSVIAV